MKSSLVRRSTVLALALVLVACTGAFAATMGVDVSTTLRVQSAATDKLLPLTLATETHALRFRAADSGKWLLHLDGAATAAKGGFSWKRPSFRAQIVTPPRTWDLWGGGYNLGGAKADPAELIVMGSLGTRPLVWGGMANAVSAGQMKIRTSFNVADVNITTDVHQLATARTNVEAYGDYKLDAATVGGVLRTAFDADPKKNTTGLVGFVKTDLSGVQVGASAGVRFGDSVSGDNLAFGVNAETKLQDGQFVLSGDFVNRQKNFYEPDAQDAGFQNGNERFKNIAAGSATAEGSLLRLTGTWLGEANKGANPLTAINATAESAAGLKGPAFQAIVQRTKDATPNPQTIVAARAGTRILPNNFWVVGQVKVTKDTDGVTAVSGVTGKESRTDIDGRVRYNLADVGLNSWFLLGHFQNQSANDGTSTGTSNTLKAELIYSAGKVKLTSGISTVKNSSATKAANSLYAQFQINM
jgi:hypothetical protein